MIRTTIRGFGDSVGNVVASQGVDPRRAIEEPTTAHDKTALVTVMRDELNVITVTQ
jgi:hypothetical protein